MVLNGWFLFKRFFFWRFCTLQASQKPEEPAEKPKVQSSLVFELLEAIYRVLEGF